MGRNIIEGYWKQVQGRIKARWDRLTDDELDRIQGNYELLCDSIQQAYGLTRREVERSLLRLH